MRARKGYDAPVGSVVVSTGIENSGHEKSPRARDEAVRSQPALRAGQREVIAGLDFQIICQDSPQKNRFDAVFIRREIEDAGGAPRAGLVGSRFLLAVNALDDHASSPSATRQ